MERSCELCRNPARMYCESDEARLCWDCDEKVHSANFLVAKHSRSLLCHVCQSPTPWKASGTKLGPTVSVCEGCFDNNSNYARNPSPTTSGMRRPHPQEEDGDETDQSVGAEDGDRDSESSAEIPDEEYLSDEEEDDENDEEEDGENQVVPWASCPSPSASSAPPLTTSSSSEHGSFSFRNDAFKRSRDSHIQESDDEDVCCSSQANSYTAAEESRKVAAFRAAKIARVEDHPELMSRRIELVGSLMSFQERRAAVSAAGEHNHNASEVTRRISNLSRGAA